MARDSKPKSATKGQNQVWKENVEGFLVICGAFRVPEPAMYEWCLHTNAGDLGITIREKRIHARFDDTHAGRVATAHIGSECGQTGKWNFYYSDKEIISQSAFIRWGQLIEDLLDYKPSEEQVKEIAVLREHYYELWPSSRPLPREKA